MVVKDFYSVFAFKPLHHLHFEVSRLLKSRLIHCWFLDRTYCHPRSSPVKPKTLKSVTLPILKACKGIVNHVEVK